MVSRSDIDDPTDAYLWSIVTSAVNGDKRLTAIERPLTYLQGIQGVQIAVGVAVIRPIISMPGS